MDNNNVILKNDEWLGQVKQAAREGAKEGAKEGTRVIGGRSISLTSIAVFVALVIICFIAITSYIKISKIKDQFDFESDASEHDLVLHDQGFLGYTVADFADAILGEDSKLCKLEVLKQEVSDAATITDAGLGKIKLFTKTQIITYHGTAIFTVDLSDLSRADFKLDDDKKVITIYIPRAELEPINIQSGNIEFGDVSKGLLAFGDIDIKPEEMAQVQTAAQEKMRKKIEELKIENNANRFAKMVVWEMYQPIINSVAKGYSLEVEFR